MSTPAGPALAVVSLVRAGRRVELGPVGEGVPCDLELVDGLLRFELAARRLGWSLELDAVDDDLRELFGLVGLPGPGATPR